MGMRQDCAKEAKIKEMEILLGKVLEKIKQVYQETGI